MPVPISRPGLVPEFIREAFHPLPVVLADQKLALRIHVANPAARLEVRRGAPLLWIKQTDFDGAGAPVLYSVEYHVADWVRFTVERIGPGSAVDDQAAER